MIENTNTKQFYPGPILNDTLEINEFLFNTAEQVKIKHSKLDENGVLRDVDLEYGYDYEVTKDEALTCEDDETPSHTHLAEMALTASTGQITLKEHVAVLAGERLTAYRESAIIQDKNYPRTGAFPAAAHEGALDYLTMQNQEQQDELDRALKVPISTQNFAGSMPLPIPGRALKINQDGSGFEMSEFDPDIALTTTENFRNEAQQFAKDSQQFATNSASSAQASANSAQTASNKVVEITNLHDEYKADITTTSTNYLNQINSRGTTIIKDADAIINRVGLNMFDPVLKDHLLTYPDGQGLALQGTWVYRDAKAGERYGYPDFYNRCVKEFKESTTASENNVTVTGTITNNNGVISGFSSANYAQIPDTPTDVKSFEMVFKFHTPAAWGDASQVVFGQGTNNNFQTPQLSISNTSSNLWIGMSSDGAAWTSVADSVPVALDTTYYVKTLWSNGTARAYLSTTKNITEEHLIGAVAMDKVLWTVPLGLGYDQNPGNTLFTGSIDLNECYININGARWWDGVRLRRHSNGHMYYPISAKSYYDTRFNNQGAAWYYGVDEANKRIFLPRNNWFMQMASNGAGNFTAAGIPDHTHTITMNRTSKSGNDTKTVWSYSENLTGAGTVTSNKASASNSVYGKSSTVQPTSIKQLLYICVGNQVQTDSWVDTITQVKNGAKEINDSVQDAIADVEEAKDECIAEIGTKTAELTSKMAFSMFDTIMKDHKLVYPYDQGFALQGTYVYHDADPGIRYGYADFYNKCVEEKSQATSASVTLGSNAVTIWTHSNGHMYYDISEKDKVDTFFNSMGMAWYYGIDTTNKRIFLPRNNWFEQSATSGQGGYVDAGLPNITGAIHMDNSGVSGAFYNAGSVSGEATAGGAGSSDTKVAFDASRVSAVYGKSSTVQPKAVKKLLYICVGNRLQDTSWIDVATQVQAGAKNIEDKRVQALNDLNNKANAGLSALANASNALRQIQITNCIKEIPQRIKYTLENGTLTIKAGSVVIVPYGTEDLTGKYPKGVTFIHENLKVYDTQFVAGKFFVWAQLVNDVFGARSTTDSSTRFITFYVHANSIDGAVSSVSGTSITTSALFYNTSTNLVEYLTNGVNADGNLAALPLGISKANGTTKFASINQIFNGFGYIGSTVWADKGIKGLAPNGRNDDRTLNNIEFETKTLTTAPVYGGVFVLNVDKTTGSASVGVAYFARVQEGNKLGLFSDNSKSGLWFNTIKNKYYKIDNGEITAEESPKIPAFTVNTTSAVAAPVSDASQIIGIDIKQPFRAVDFNELDSLRTDINSTPHIVEAYVNGTSGYNIYSNKYCEQWGYSSATGTRTITLLKAYNNTSYIPVASHAYGSNRNNNARVTAVAATTFSVYCEDKIFWHTKGYIT